MGVDSTGLPARVTSARICPSPGVSISSASVATGSSPPNSGRPRTRLFQTPKWPRSPQARGEPDQIDRGRGEHRAAGAIEVAGHHVDDVDQPGGQAAELLRAHADPAVGDRRRRGGKVAGKPGDAIGGDADTRRHPRRREARRERAHLLDAIAERAQPTGIGEPFGEDRVQEREQEIGVAARLDEQVLVGDGRRLGAPRVDDDQASAARAQRLQPLARSPARS